jgi:hypothetical protein
MSELLSQLRDEVARNWLSFGGIALLALAGLLRFVTRSVVQRRFALSEYDASRVSKGYRAQRRMDLARTPTDVGLSDLDDEIVAYGVVIDFGEVGAITTLVALATGEARIYLSNGQELANTERSPDPNSTRRAAKDLVAEAQHRLPWMRVTGRFPLPRMGRARLQVLTQRGVFAETVRITPVEPPLATLWNAGQKLADALVNRERHSAVS